MKNTYSSVFTLAAALLLSAGVTAQSLRTVGNAAQQANLTIKKHGVVPASGTASLELRGGVANDECTGATIITVGSACNPTTGTVNGASQSLDPSTCSNFLSNSANDVWYTFTATGAVTIISVTGDGDNTTGVDLILEAYTGPCATAASLGCVDATVRGGTEQLTLNTTIGTTYYYRTYPWDYAVAETVFGFTTCVYSPTNVPSNDLCDGAVNQALSVGASVVFNGDNTGALDTEGLGAPNVWESFTTTECATIVVSYCGTTPAFENGFINLVTGCPPAALIDAASFDQTTCVDGNLTVQFDYVPAGTYYYPVLSEEGSEGPYTITVTATACPAGYCAASADACDEYIANVQFGSINNASACTDGPAVDYTAISTDIAQGAALAMTVENGPNTYEGDQCIVWIDWNQDEVLNGAGEEFVLTTADLAATFTGTITAPANAVLGPTRMRIRMLYTGAYSPCGTSDYGEVEDYTVNVVMGQGAPANDMCGDVTAVALAVGGSVNFTGTTVGATNTGDFEPGSDLDGLDPTVWHAFTLTECADVTVSYCDTDPGFGNVWIFLSPSCPAGNDYILAGSNDFTSCVIENATLVYPGLEPGTYYVPVLFDAAGANGDYDITVSAAACVTAGPYCNAGATNISAGLEKIANVTFADINNNSTSLAGYEDFTGITAYVGTDLDYPFSVTPSDGWESDQLYIWIDFDHSNSFEPGELVHTSAIGAGPYSGTISIPAGAMLGATRMRIRLQDTHDGTDYANVSNTTPCGNSTFGQVEDYTVSIDIGTSVDEHSTANWSVFPNPGNGDFTIQYAGADSRLTLDVLDMTGRLVHTEQQQVSKGQQVLLTMAGRLAAGTYMLRLSTEQGRSEQRIVIR